MHFKSAARILSCLVLLSAASCHSLFGADEENVSAKDSSTRQRISVLENTRKIQVDPDLASFNPEIPAPSAFAGWPQSGGNSEHNVGNAAIQDNPDILWRSSIGDGTDSDFKLLAAPVVSGGKVFTLDSKGLARAFSTENGERLWSFDTTPEDRDDETMGGGVATDGKKVFVTTGFGEVLALAANNGSVIWRKHIGKPLRSAPTLAKNRVYVVSIDNELTALSALDGSILWHHNGIAESAILMGSSSPAVQDDGVFVAYGSGELFNLRAQNGRVAWSDMLSVPEKVGALPAIADIRGLPVVNNGRVYAISHSGRMAALDLRTGDRAFDIDIGGINTPLVIGSAIFIVDNDNTLICLSRVGGRVAWMKQLQRLEDDEDKSSSPVFWWGPIMAGNKLWLTNSLGQLTSYSPENGEKISELDVAGKFFIPPIASDGMLFTIADNGTLIALR